MTVTTQYNIVFYAVQLTVRRNGILKGFLKVLYTRGLYTCQKTLHIFLSSKPLEYLFKGYV